MLDRHANLYADLSGLNLAALNLSPLPTPPTGAQTPPAGAGPVITSPEFIRLLEDYHDRFLFGTDVHTVELYVGLLDIVAWFRDNVIPQLSPETAEAIAHGNAERLIKIAPSAPLAVAETKMVSVTLGPTNTEDGLRQLPRVSDGPTKEASLDGRPCRLMVSNGTPTRYMYFNVQNDFIYAKATKVVVTVDYFDAGIGWLALQYDSSDFTAEPLEGRFKMTESVRLRNSGTWQTATFKLSDAYFSDRQHNTVSDFRVASDQDLAVSRVTVSR